MKESDKNKLEDSESRGHSHYSFMARNSPRKQKDSILEEFVPLLVSPKRRIFTKDELRNHLERMKRPERIYESCSSGSSKHWHMSDRSRELSLKRS